MIWLWLAAIVAFGVTEALTAGLVCVWFAVGAVAALLSALAGAAASWQWILFAVVSAIALVLSRPLARKLTKVKAEATNADRVLGMTGRVTEEIDNAAATGAVYVDGKTWTARSGDGSVIPAGSMVEIERMEGVKLFVKYSEKKTEVH